jgi:hypothetical protein
MQFVYWLVRVDPEILSGCPTIDRFQTYSKALLLCAVGGIAFFAWGGFFAWFWPVYVALPLTVIVVVWIILIDQIMGASRWALQGVLAPPKARAFGLSAALILRLAIGLVTASATSISATMLISHAKIEAQIQKNRDAENAAKRAAGEAEKKQASQNLLGGRDAEVKAASAEVASINDKLDAARRVRESAGLQLVDNKVKADCQLNGGPGCHKGAGYQFREAQTRAGKAAADLRQAEADIPALETALAAAARKRDDALAAYREREPEFLEAAKEIDKRVTAEAVPPRNDPVMSYMALQEVMNSPDQGERCAFLCAPDAYVAAHGRIVLRAGERIFRPCQRLHGAADRPHQNPRGRSGGSISPQDGRAVRARRRARAHAVPGRSAISGALIHAPAGELLLQCRVDSPYRPRVPRCIGAGLGLSPDRPGNPQHPPPVG